MLAGSLPALALLLWLVLRNEKDTALWLAIIPAWLAGLMGWALWSRRQVAKSAPLDDRREEPAEPMRPPDA